MPVGAVIVRNGEIIAAAYNQKETLQDPTAHAEMLVIREVFRKLGRWRSGRLEFYRQRNRALCMGAVIQKPNQKNWFTGHGNTVYGVETTAELGKASTPNRMQRKFIPGICEEKWQKAF